MIKGLCDHNQLTEACELLRKMEDNMCSPDFYSYDVIVLGLLKNKEIPKVLQLIEEMIDKNITVSASVVEFLADFLSALELNDPSTEMLQKFF